MRTKPPAEEAGEVEDTSGLNDKLAANAIGAYELSPDSSVERINISENTTYRVDDPESGLRYALRVHRLGYHSVEAIESELAWVEALHEAGVVETARPVPTPEGSRVVAVSIVELPEPRNVVLFEWLEGAPPDADDMASFRRLGAICARLHAHARSWRRPAGFTRPAWDSDQLIGPHGRAGRWQDALGMGREELSLLTRLEETIRRRLAAYGQGQTGTG